MLSSLALYTIAYILPSMLGVFSDYLMLYADVVGGTQKLINAFVRRRKYTSRSQANRKMLQ